MKWKTELILFIENPLCFHFSVGIKPSPGLSSKHGADLTSAAGKSTSQTDLLQQLQHLQSLLQNHGSDKDAKVKFDKKLLDFDYGEEENEEEKNQTAADALGR